MTGWIIDALLASALLMAAVLLLRTPARGLFGATIAYGLWALPVLRLLLPPLPQSWSAAAPMTRAGDLIVFAASFADELENPAQSGPPSIGRPWRCSSGLSGRVSS